MNYWMVKSEPGVYSYDNLQKDGTTTWDGIRSYAARLHLKAMKKDDIVFFYHSNTGKEITGIARVVKEAYPDPSSPEEWMAVDIKALKKLNNPVTLEQIKKDKRLKKIPLLTISRLSVMPVTKDEHDAILDLAG